MATVTNDFARFTIVNLDPESPARGPFIVSQQGSDPQDPKVQVCTYLLTRDGEWVRWASVFAVPGGMADDLLFDSAKEMVEVVERLTGKAKFRRLEVDAKASLAKIEEIEAAGGLRVAIRYLLDKRKQENKN
jgi:hypothetical protein